MKYYRQTDRDARSAERLKAYDALIRARVGESYPYPIRMRHWELCEVLERLPPGREDIEILDTGSFNTYLGIWLAEVASRVVVSDLLVRRAMVSGLRRLRVKPTKPTEAPFTAWYRALRRAAPSIEIRNVDLTRMRFPDESFDYITSISVIEHIPEVERAVAEMYRCLKPNGMLLLTTDSSPTGKPYNGGVRYFTESELESLFGAYPVTSPRVAADFSEENWCYFKDKPLTTVFIEITKPAA